MRRTLSTKYWKRANHRGDQILHAATNFIVWSAAKNRAALALEDLANIRKMYRRSRESKQGRDYRFQLNSWPYRKAYHMLQYKSAWKGVTFVRLTKSDTYGSSSRCSACGEKLHKPARGDVAHARILWCQTCKKLVDRDVNAVGTLSERGLARFASSHPLLPLLPSSSVGRSQQVASGVRDNEEEEEGERKEGLTREARKWNPPQTAVILRVDASKLLTRSFDREAGLSMENAILDQTKR